MASKKIQLIKETVWDVKDYIINLGATFLSYWI